MALAFKTLPPASATGLYERDFYARLDKDFWPGP